MLTLKFGGTSVGSADAISQTVSVIANTKARDLHVAVVTSAMSGVTDLLVNSARSAAAGQRQPFLDAREVLFEKHLDAARELIDSEEERAVYQQHITEQLGFFSRLCSSINVLGELTPRGLDVVSGLALDFIHGQMINLRTATFLVNPDVVVCCTPAVLCFADDEEASRFQKGFRGTVATLEDAKKLIRKEMTLSD